MQATDISGECLLHRGLGGVELFDFPIEALEGLRRDLQRLAGDGYTRVSLHAPMPRPSFYPHPGVACFFLHEDPSLRALSFRVMEETLRLARAWDAAYVVTHLTYGRTDTADRNSARQLASEACARLAAMSARHDVPIDIEYAAYSAAFNRPEDFVEAMAACSPLGICIDTGHAMLGAQRWQRSYLDDIRVLAPRARSMHLWNTRGPDDQRWHGHVPLHPSQTPALGWVDFESTLQIVLGRRPDVSIIFEYPVGELTTEYQAGYDWVAAMVERIRKGHRTMEETAA